MSANTTDNPYSPTALGIYGVTILFYSVVYMVLMILPFYALAQGESNSSIGAIMGVTMLASMFARPWAGRLIDKHGANRVFLYALIIFAISLLGYFTHSLAVYWIVRLVQGVVAACFSTAMEIITIDLLSKRLRAQGVSLYSLATVIPTTFGPALTLWLKDRVSFEEIFLLFFVMGALNIIFAFLLSNKTTKLELNSQRSTAGTLKDFLSQSKLLYPTLIMLLASVANGAIFVFLPLFLTESGSDHAATYFLAQMITLVVTRFVGSKWIPSDGSLSLKYMLLLASIICFGTFAIYFSQNLWWLIAAAIANGIGFALLYPSLLTFISFLVENESRGYFIGLFIGAADLGFALGSLVMGPIADWYSIHTIFLACGVCTLLIFPLCFSCFSRDKLVEEELAS